MVDVEQRVYHISDFARLAGVTARALHHYDRLGLLKPKRSAGGYRTYSARDLERLEQIIALKFIGVPLKKIRFFTSRTPSALTNALRAQRQTLEARRHLLDLAITAIGEAEKAAVAGEGANPLLYRRIIEVIEMQNNTEWNEKYQALLQAKANRLSSLSPEQMADLRRKWAVLVEDVRGSLTEDPGSPKAQALASRWVALLEQLMGGPIDPSMMGSAAAYQKGGAPSPGGPSPADQPVWDFIGKALRRKL